MGLCLLLVFSCRHKLHGVKAGEVVTVLSQPHCANWKSRLATRELEGA